MNANSHNLPDGRKISLRVLALAAACVLVGGGAARAATVNPGDFNVYSLGDIGSSGSAYGSDFQGVAGAGGDAWFGGFTLSGLDTADGRVLFTGGSTSLVGGDIHGSIDAGGDVTLGSFSTSGDVVSGGSVEANGGWIGGSVTAAGDVNFSGAGAGGTVSPNTPYQPAVDHDAMGRYFRDTSARVAGWSDTGAIADNWGGLSYTADSGVNVVSIDADDLRAAWGFALTGPDDAVVYVNVSGTDPTLDWLDWSFSGGIGAGDVLLNYHEAQSLTLNQGGGTNLLAPNADVTYGSGVWNGSIVAGRLEGGGQVNTGTFRHYGPVPEPTTVAILALGAAGALWRRGRIRRAS